MLKGSAYDYASIIIGVFFALGFLTFGGNKFIISSLIGETIISKIGSIGSFLALGFLVFLTPKPKVLATVPIVGFIIPKTSPNKPLPFLGRPRRLLAPSPDNSGIELILPCKELVALCSPLCPALLTALIIGLI